jgi:hypothetical protein
VALARPIRVRIRFLQSSHRAWPALRRVCSVFVFTPPYEMNLLTLSVLRRATHSPARLDAAGRYRTAPLAVGWPAGCDAHCSPSRHTPPSRVTMPRCHLAKCTPPNRVLHVTAASDTINRWRLRWPREWWSRHPAGPHRRRPFRRPFGANGASACPNSQCLQLTRLAFESKVLHSRSRHCQASDVTPNVAFYFEPRLLSDA